jgi:hypothetical protein
LEQEFEQRHGENLRVCRADFRSKTDAALVWYKQGCEALERQVRDLEVDLKGAHEARRGAERALAEADATINTLQRDAVGVLDTGVSRSTCSWAPSSAHL